VSVAPGQDGCARSALVYGIENVADARPERIEPVMLCGRMFGLEATDDDGTRLVLDRHRLFESSVLLVVPPHPKHDRTVQVAGAYGGARRDKDEARNVRKRERPFDLALRSFRRIQEPFDDEARHVRRKQGRPVLPVCGL